MKYTYAYKTSDGIRHEDTMNASSREEVFSELRKRGIKAIKVVAADGSKANGEIRGVRRRVVIILLALVALSVGIIAYLTGTNFGTNRSDLPVPNLSVTGSESNPYASAANVDKTRRQVFGDEAIVAKGIRTGWTDVFTLEGDRFLASFAIPGVKAGQRNTSLKEFEAAINSKCEITPADSPEARQIKAMVEGMKDEARQYIAAGGTIVDYGKRLTERQDAEIAIYERIKSEIEKAKATLSEDDFMDVWERRNEELRNLGIKTVGLE
jgi:hypothetical protein